MAREVTMDDVAIPSDLATTRERRIAMAAMRLRAEPDSARPKLKCSQGRSQRKNARPASQKAA